MDFPHLHLLLNHFPIIGTMVGAGLFLISFLLRAEDVRRSSLIVFVAMALLAIPAFITGVCAQEKTPAFRTPSFNGTKAQPSWRSGLWRSLARLPRLRSGNPFEKRVRRAGAQQPFWFSHLRPSVLWLEPGTRAAKSGIWRFGPPRRAHL